MTARIGEGGMGEVYRATDTNLGRQVAIKVLPDAFAHDADRLARFEREAKTLASLNHANIAIVHGLERIDDGRALVMELVDGPTLAERIAEGPVALDEAIPIARQIAAALDAAHEQGIVHRDLKPANIKVRRDGTVKVLDFGLAKALESGGGSSHRLTHSPTITSPAMMTGAGVLLGTAAYMSPEQARGKVVDKRTDIWAFGAVLYEMLSGRRAFAGDDVSDVLASVLAREPDWTCVPSSISPVLNGFLKRCLEKDPRQRIRDIGDVALALDGTFETMASPAPPPAVTKPSGWRRILPIALTGLVAVLITGLAAWKLWPREAARSPAWLEYLLPDGQQLQPTQRPVIAMSADGSAFVYQTADGLYHRPMNALEARLIPGTQESLTSPFLSPDGQWVGYFAATGQLKKVAVSGGTPVTLCAAAFPFGASWARDNTILFGQPAGIMRVSDEGGAAEIVVRAVDGELMYGPQPLPGNHVLFSVTKGLGPGRWDEAQIVVQSLSSGQRTVVMRGGSDARYIPTGHLVYVLRDGLFGARFDLNRLSVTGSVPLVQGVQRPGGVVAVASNYAISDTGTLVYLAAITSRQSLVWVDRNGATEPIRSIPAGPYEDPRLSPDGTRALVTRDGDIWIYDLASGRSSKVTQDGSSLMGVWAPSGAQVAYSSAKAGNLEAWVTSSDGSSPPRQLTKLGGQVHVDSWSPDGRLLTFHHHRPDASSPTTARESRAILTLAMDRADAKPEVFLEAKVTAEGANLSRDGHYVSYLSQESGQREIYVRPYPGPGGQETVSVGGGQEPIWAKNGDLFYRSLNGQRMFAVPVTTAPTLKVGTSVELFQGPYYVSPTGSPRPQYDVTADGQRVLMLAAIPNTNTSRPRRIVVVQNWTEELKQRIPLK